MAGKVRFYRGEQGASLPLNHQDGAIFIIERDSTNALGDMYVDMNNGKRLHIIPDSGFKVYESIMNGQPSELGQVYVCFETRPSASQTTEQAALNPNKLFQVGIKVGDGKAFIGDLPTYEAVTVDQRKIWNSKVDAFIASEIYAQSPSLNFEGTNRDDDEELVLTRMLYFDTTIKQI